MKSKQLMTLTLSALTSLTTMLPMTVHAQVPSPVMPEWKQEQGNWFYLSSGHKKNGWAQIQNKWYYFAPGSGKMLTGWQKIQNGWYYLTPGSGEMKTGWLQDGGKWYYLDTSTGKMKSGFQYVYSDPYHFSEDGAMQTGWWYRQSKQEWYYFFAQSGKAARGWNRIGGKWYYFAPYSAEMYKGWSKINNQWYYLDPVNGDMKTGWTQIGSNSFYLDPDSGVMKTGWLQDGSNLYYLKSNGALATNQWIRNDAGTKEYYVDSTGKKTQERALTSSGSSTGNTGTNSGTGSNSGNNTGTSTNPGSNGADNTDNNPSTNTGTSSGTSQTKPNTGNQKPSGGSTNIHVKPQDTPSVLPGFPEPDKYHYEAYAIPRTLYTGCDIPFYIKTDNDMGVGIDPVTKHPNGTRIYLKARKSDGSDVTLQSIAQGPSYINNANGSEYGGNIAKVEGGYLILTNFKEAGTFELYLEESLNDHHGLPIVLGTITVLDGNKAHDAWQYEMIEKYSTSDMKPQEKLQAVANGLRNEFKYLKRTPDDHYASLIEDYGDPYWIRKEWDSMVSPANLAQIAHKIGGFEEIKNLYGEYPRGSHDWTLYHAWVDVKVDGEWYMYTACPPIDSNIQTNIIPFDYTNLSAMHKIS